MATMEQYWTCQHETSKFIIIFCFINSFRYKLGEWLMMVHLGQPLRKWGLPVPVWWMFSRVHIKGFRPEWYISTIYHCRDTSFWLETLNMYTADCLEKDIYLWIHWHPMLEKRKHKQRQWPLGKSNTQVIHTHSFSHFCPFVCLLSNTVKKYAINKKLILHCKERNLTFRNVFNSNF